MGVRAISSTFEININIVSSLNSQMHRIIYDENVNRNIYFGHEFEFHYIRLETESTEMTACNPATENEEFNYYCYRSDTIFEDFLTTETQCWPSYP